MARPQQSNPLLTADDVQVLDNVLADGPTPDGTRRALLRRAAIGAGAVASATMLGPVSGALAHGHGHGHGDSVTSVGITAVTAEALAVTYLGQVLQVAPAGTPKEVAQIISAARAEEQLHHDFLHHAGFKPLTQKFWIPDGFFGDLQTIAATIEAAETLFVNAYLVGITVFAKAGKPDLARYAGEILGVEAEHRTLARNLQGKLPNNLAFESYRLHTTAQHVKALEKLGVGFGKEGSAPGRFYHYRHASTPGVEGRTPR
jgi:hypothetical protein